MSATTAQLEARVRELEAALRAYAPMECSTGGFEGCGCVGCRVRAVLVNSRSMQLTSEHVAHVMSPQMLCAECGSSSVHWEEAIFVRHHIRCSICNEPFADGATVLRRTSGGQEEIIHEFCAGPRR